jgi:hypothetical protein
VDGGGKLSSNSIEARRIARQAKSFSLIDGDLYRQGAAGILMRCILTDQEHQLMQDIHVGACGHHVAPRAIFGSVFLEGFY